MASEGSQAPQQTVNIQNSQQQPEKYKVPAGLRPLLEAFARETLRTQPQDLVQFGRVFFETLGEQRERNAVTSVEALFGDKINYDIFRSELHQKVFLTSVKIQMNSQLKATACLEGNAGGGAAGASGRSSGSSPVNSSPQLQRPCSPMDIAATKIQAAFRGHRVRAHPEKFGLDAELVNGICQKQKMRRNSNERLALSDNRKDLKRHSVGGYSHAQQLNATPEDRAATKIQAEIRGFLTRKHVEQEKKENQKAATKIQAHIRGYLTRKHLEEQGIVLSPPRSRTSTAMSKNGN